MNPTNPMSMHDLVRAEHAYRYAKLDQRRHEREAMAAVAATRSHAAAATRSHAATPSMVTRAHRRMAFAVATVATLLALAAGAAAAAAPHDTTPQAPAHHSVPAGGHAPRVE